jgi:hypothetical protein
VDDDEPNGSVPHELERLIAGTFALMTTWYQCPQPAICQKLMENLALIGRHEAVSDGLRRVCANAAARWAAYLEEVEVAIESGAASDEDCEDEDEPVGVTMDPVPGRITLH